MFKFSLLRYGSIGLLVVACSGPAKKTLSEQHAALAWADMTVYITKNTPANTPTFASRGLGYIGLTMYESIVHGFRGYQSMNGQLNGLSKLPVPVAGQNYDWNLSLNAAQSFILQHIYIQTSVKNKQKIDSLERFYYDYYSPGVEAATVKRSVAFGRAVAESIFEWSKIDGGHRGYLQNFDKKYRIDYKPGLWEPPLYGQTFSHLPLHPHWGKNRNFAVQNAEMPLPSMLAYDTAKESAYYKQFWAVYEKSKKLSQKEKEIALWWNDDPNETFTPPGHSYQLAITTLEQAKVPLIQCAETFARVGLAVGDAFINCWRWKYHYKSERPFSYITRYIDNEWESFWPDPPFPAFPSGHATQAAAVASVLTDLFGEHFSIADSAHLVRPKDKLRNVEYVPQVFASFWQIAQETADSRFYGGIHSPQDNAAGLEQGRVIGENINRLKWHATTTE